MQQPAWRCRAKLGLMLILLVLLTLPVAARADSSGAACQAAALSRPSLLAGRYQTYNVPNDNHYEIRFALPELIGCDGLGKRKVTIFQQKLEPYGVHQTLQWSANGLSTSIATNQAKHGAVVLRAAHLCSPADAYGDFDKKHHIGVRPAVKITWTPATGTPASAVFSGAASPACKPGTAYRAAAQAGIVLGQGVGSIRLGATAAEVKHKLGAPDTRLGNEWRWPESVGLQDRLKHGRVDQILSYLKSQRTPASIGVGSFAAQLKSAYPHATCHEGPPGIPYLYCVVASRFQGRPSYTGFLFEAADGSVVEVELGFGSVAQALKHP